jgi:hypothetical protein
VSGIGLDNFHEKDYLIRPKVTYAFNDALTGLVGPDIFHGPDDSLFGQLRHYSSAHVELQYRF